MMTPLALMIHAQAQPCVRDLTEADWRLLADMEQAVTMAMLAGHPARREPKTIMVDGQWVSAPHWRRLDNRGDVAAQDFVEGRP